MFANARGSLELFPMAAPAILPGQLGKKADVVATVDF